MSAKKHSFHDSKVSTRPQAHQETQHPQAFNQQRASANVVQRARNAPGLLAQRDALHLQSTLGNRAVSRLLAESRQPSHSPVVQRYIENDPALAPGKVSEGGNVVMTDNKTVYATDTKIQEANTALNNAQQTTFKLVSGTVFNRPDPASWAARFGNNPPPLKQVKSVFKPAALTGAQANTQPVEGDTHNQEQAKLTTYKQTFTDKILAISDLKNKLRARWWEEEAQRSGLRGLFKFTGIPTEVWGDFSGHIVALINDVMGPMWATTTTALTILMPQGDARNQLTLAQHMTLFDSLASDYMAKFSTQLAPEMNLNELWMTLPNDCKNAAMILTGKTALGLNQASQNPQIGENYAVHFPPDMNYGWATHYATVIMKDAQNGTTDNVTFETAASINAGMQEGKSLGFFEMYGTQNPVQTFDYISWRKNRTNVNQQVQVGLQQAQSVQARQVILDEQDEDYGRIDQHLATLTPIPDDDDF